MSDLTRHTTPAGGGNSEVFTLETVNLMSVGALVLSGWLLVACENFKIFII
jgi:hypothetical protein